MVNAPEDWSHGAPFLLTIPESPRSRMKNWSEEIDLADENLSTAEVDELLALPWELYHKDNTHTHTQTAERMIQPVQILAAYQIEVCPHYCYRIISRSAHKQKSLT